jgi:hypothetical protein
MFKTKFKTGVPESILYFFDWMVEVNVYDICNENGKTLFLIKPISKANDKGWAWLNSDLFY